MANTMSVTDLYYYDNDAIFYCVLESCGSYQWDSELLEPILPYTTH